MPASASIPRPDAILCDPWVNPAYFASWFPFPDNSELDWDALGDCDYLYVSHLHKDHFDPKNLSEHVNKDAVVLLPDFPVPDLRATGEAGLPPVLRDHRLGQAPRQRAQGRSRRHDHRAARACGRPDRRLRPGGRRRRDRLLQHERRATGRPRRAACRFRGKSTCTCCSTPARSGTRWSTTCLRAPRKRSALRSVSGRWTAAANTSRRSGQPGWSRPPVRRASWISAARPQRRSRRPGQHLPRPGRLPRADAHPRP